MAAALALRGSWLLIRVENDACRLIFSEADGLPGIVADRYNDLVVLQLLTQGTAQDDVRGVVTEALVEGLGQGISVWERPDARVRELERLGAPGAGALYGGDEAEADDGLFDQWAAVQFRCGGGAEDGGVSGSAAELCCRGAIWEGVGLDVCTYQGGFALHLAQVCERVTGVDASRGGAGGGGPEPGAESAA